VISNATACQLGYLPNVIQPPLLGMVNAPSMVSARILTCRTPAVPRSCFMQSVNMAVRVRPFAGLPPLEQIGCGPSTLVGDAPHWNMPHGGPILSLVDDTPHRRPPADWEPPMPSEAELLASLARSEAELAAGQIVSGDDVLRELDESIARMKAKRAGRTLHRTATRR
jgi:hypothetical protein